MIYDNNNFIQARQQSISLIAMGTLNSNVKVLFMDDLDLEEQLQALFAEGKAAPPSKRVRINNAIGRLLEKYKFSLAKSRSTWQGFDEGWFLLIRHFCKNLWEIEPGSSTESPYCDSEKIVHRLRWVLRCKISEAERKIIEIQQQEKSLDAPIGDGDGYTLLDLQAAPETVNHDEKLKRAVEEDVNGEFSGTKMGSQLHINARNSLLLYFQFEDWAKVAKELGADNINSFNSFRTDKIEPLITKNLGLWDLVDLDVTGELQRTVMMNYPHINAQKVLHLKLRGQRTSYMARQLGVSETKLLTEFINEKCLPLLNGLSN